MIAKDRFFSELVGLVVCVIWYDSQGSDKWERKEDYSPPSLHPISSWGIIQSYDHQKIVLAGHNSKHWWGNLTLIPTNVILSIETLLPSIKPPKETKRSKIIR